MRGVLLALCLGVTGVWADGPEDQYVHVYSLIQEADAFNDAGQPRQAVARYAEAQAALAKFPTQFPGWNENLIRFRLNYVNSKLAPLVALLPAVTNQVAQPGQPGAGTLPPGGGGETNRLLRQIQEEVNRLQSDNASLAAKLKEALSVQPSTTDPREIARAEEKNKSLQKENELLKVSLNQEQAKAASRIEPEMLAEANRALTDTRGKLAAQEQALSALKTENEVLKKQAASSGGKKAADDGRLARQVAQARDNLAALQAQHDKVQAQRNDLESRVKDLEARLSKATAAAETAAAESRKLTELQKEMDKEAIAARAAARENQDRLERVEKERAQLARDKAELEARLVAAPATNRPSAPAEAGKIKQLETELARQGEASKAALKESQERGDRFEKELARLTKEKFDLEERLARAASPAPSGTAAEVRKVKKLQDELEKQSEEAKQAAAENRAKIAELSKEISQLTKAKVELESKLAAGAAQAAKVEVKRRQDLEDQVAGLRAKLEKTEKQLEKQRTAAKGGSGDMQKQVEALKARLEVLEAKPEPYTAEEMAVLRAPATHLLASASQGQPATPPTTTAIATSAAPGTKPARAKRTPTQLPPGAGAMDAAAQRSFLAGRFDEAEKKYIEILRQDEKNIYVLGNLASVQLEMNKLDEAEKHLATALQQDPEDDYCLYLKGRLLYKRGKMDESLETLSKAVAANPESAETQNQLGLVLAEKGLRAQAEAAFRKAIQLQPGYANAHNNLAFVYATQKPPSLALARWHYQKALAAGHPKNPELEKLLGL
jgi:tetratricopeptide (TPR) repeat protein